MKNIKLQLAVAYGALFISCAVNAHFLLSSFSKEKTEIKTYVEYREPMASVVTRSLNTSYRPSMARNAMVSYSVQISSSLSLSGGQSGTVILQTSPDNATWTTIATQTNNNTGALTIGLNTVQVQACSLTGFVKMGNYVRLTTSGTSTFAWQSGMEVLL